MQDISILGLFSHNKRSSDKSSKWHATNINLWNIKVLNMMVEYENEKGTFKEYSEWRRMATVLFRFPKEETVEVLHKLFNYIIDALATRIDEIKKDEIRGRYLIKTVRRLISTVVLERTV